MAAQNIPQELLSHIAGNVSDDKATLRSCSLVCRSWASACGYFLFRLLHLRRPSGDDVKKGACRALLQLLETSSRMAGCVMELDLDGFRDSGFEFAELTLPVLDGILSLLPRLQDLRLRRMVRLNRDVPPPSSRKAPVKNLRSVELQDSVIFTDDPTNLACLLGLFDSIEDLSITVSGSWNASMKQRSPARATRRTSITKISIRAVFDSDSRAICNILEVIAAIVQPNTTKTIIVDPFEPGIIPSLSETLRRCTSLCELRLALGRPKTIPRAMSDSSFQHLDLTQCSRLRSIHLSGVKQRLSDEDRVENMQMWDTLCDILSNTPSSLGNITLELEIADAFMPAYASQYALYDWSHLEEINWKRLDGALNAFHNLENLHLLTTLRHSRGPEIGDKIIGWLSPKLRPVIKYEARHEIYSFIDPLTGSLRVVHPTIGNAPCAPPATTVNT